jgi:Protein of unknown function (DUF3253)
MCNDSNEVQPKDLRESVLDALTNSSEKTLSAQEIARAVVADDSWPSLLVPIRRAAIELALAGRLVIYRKGKPVDPTDFKGVYRLGLPRHD